MINDIVASLCDEAFIEMRWIHISKKSASSEPDVTVVLGFRLAVISGQEGFNQLECVRPLSGFAGLYFVVSFSMIPLHLGSYFLSDLPSARLRQTQALSRSAQGLHFRGPRMKVGSLGLFRLTQLAIVAFMSCLWAYCGLTILGPISESCCDSSFN